MNTSEVQHSSVSNTPAYFARFGLKREPFSTSVEDDLFFSEAEGGERLNLSRFQRLNLLLHLAPYSDVLLVTGDAGIGKTTLLHQFLTRVEPTWRVCAVSASPTVNNDVISQCLLREFAKEEVASTGGLSQIDSLRKHIQVLRESSLSPILIIDDAHELSQEALIFLLQLVQTNKTGSKLLSVIIFSEPSIEKTLALNELAPLRNLISHSFELTPFNEEDTGNYIKQRLSIAGLTGDSPFTPAVVKVIHGTSHGIPGKINELSQVVLNNSVTVDFLPQTLDATSPRVDIFKRYWLAGLFAILLVAVLMFQHKINTTFEGSNSSEADRIAALQKQSDPGQLSTEITPLQSAVSTRDTGLNPSAEIKPSSTDGIDTKAPAAGMIVRQEVPDAEVTSQDKILANMKTSPDSDTSNTDVPGTAQLAVPDGEDVIDGREDRNIATVEVVVTDKEKKVSTINNAAASVTSNTTKPEPKPKAEPKPAAHDKSVIAKSDMIKAETKPVGTIHREDWLLKQDPQHYTLQLMAVREEAAIVKFIKDHDLHDDVAYFNTTNDGKEWLAVVYGSYQSKDAAQAVSKHLSETVTGIKPWTRSLASVQSSIKSHQNSH